MRITKKILLVCVLLGSYLFLSNGVFATPADKSSLIPEQLYPQLPAGVVPELAAKGRYTVGVRTMRITNPAQFDPATQKTKDRTLTVEVWYPSVSKNHLSKKHAVKTSYENVTRSHKSFSIQADAYRNAKVITETNGTKFPLVVISHGYPGDRILMFYLGEHLASHGYVVAAIGHTDSTMAEINFKKAPYSGFFSTLLNRSRDQQFTLNYFTTKANFTAKIIDPNNAGLIGYSMGGYGAVNTIGGCYSFTDATASAFTGVKDPAQIVKIKTLLNSCAGGQYQHVKVDPKWKAVIAMAPWGGQHHLFNKQALAKITTPILYVDGNLDDVADYDNGVQSLYEQTGSQKKYFLTYLNARHNIAPHPAPAVSRVNIDDFSHYYEPVWSNVELNNINKHFALAMMDCYLKKQQQQCKYLDLSGNSNQKVINGKMPPPWKGFDNRFSAGMTWQKR